MFRIFLLALWVLVSVAPAHGSEGEEPTEEEIRKKIKKLVVPNLTGTETVDGVLDEPFWQYAAVLKLEREVFPTPLAPAVVETEVRIVRLQDYLLIGFTAYDPEPERIQAPWRDRDGIDTDDYVSFMFDPAGKNAKTYELKVSAGGVQGDEIRTRIDDRRIRDWDARWESAAKIVPEGYVVEMRLPLAEFDWPMHRGVKRFLVFKRHYPREVRRTLGAFAVVVVAEETLGLDKTLLVIPTATFVSEIERPLDKEDRIWEETLTPTVSLDIVYKPSPSLSLLGTVNPNYLQVEADLAKSSINNAFTTLQPEKRLFFTANQDAFSSLFYMVYTRNIDEPRVGAKLAGSVGDLTTGNFLIDDKNLHMIVPGNLGSDKVKFDSSDSRNAAFRYRYDFRPGLSLGATATARTGSPDTDVSDYQSLAGGIDGYLKLGRFDEIRAQWVGSTTEYPEAITDELCDEEGACDDPEDDSGLPGQSSFNEQVLRADPDRTYRDDALWVTYKHWQREWFFIGRYLDVGEDFRGDLGFIKKIDYRLGSGRGGYTWYLGQDEEEEEGRRLRLSANYLKQESQAGELLMESREAWLQFWGANQFRIDIIYRDRDRVAKRFLQNTLEIEGNSPEFNEDQIELRFESSPFRSIRFSLKGTIGEEIDKENYRLGDVLELEPEIRWYAGDRVELTLKDTYKHLDVEGGRLFIENYLTLSLTYQLRKGSFVRFTFIDDYVRRDPDLYLFEEEDELERDTTGELLLAWKPGEESLFIVGLKGGAHDSGGLDQPAFDNWLFYVKFSRAFRW